VEGVTKDEIGVNLPREKFKIFLHFTEINTTFALENKNTFPMAETRYINPYTDFGFTPEEPFHLRNPKPLTMSYLRHILQKVNYTL
jgi:hypothetical protein